MALKYLIPIDLNSNEIRNVLAHLLGSDPGSPVEGQFWYNTAGHTLKLRLASTTVDLQNPVLLNSQAGSYYLARANHSGTQLAATISDFDTQVRTSRLDQMAAPNTDVSMASHKLTNVTDPGSAQDAATKNYVDGIATGSVYWKNPVRVGITTNITVSNPGTAVFDGVTLTSGDRVALMGQTTGSENGIYTFTASGTAMVRATDADTSAEVKSGMAFWVNEGTANGDTSWTLTTNDPITLGTTSLTFVQFSGLGQITAGAGLTKTGNTLNVVGNAGRIVANADDVDLASGIATPGTYRSVTVDTYGRVTAGTNPTAIGKYSALIGTGAATAITVTAATHGLGATNQLQTQAYEATGAWVMCDISVAASGDVTFTFAVAPASNAIRIVIIG